MAQAEQAAECLRTIGHPDRLRLIGLLLDAERHSVGELAERLGLSQPVVSTHLRLLKDRSLVRSERNGREVYYSVCEPHLRDVMGCVWTRFGCGTGNGESL